MYANTKGHFSTHNVYPFTFNEWAIRSTSACIASHERGTEQRKQPLRIQEKPSLHTKLAVKCAITWSSLEVSTSNSIDSDVTCRDVMWHYCVSVIRLIHCDLLWSNIVELPRTWPCKPNQTVPNNTLFHFIIPKQLHNCVCIIEYLSKCRCNHEFSFLSLINQSRMLYSVYLGKLLIIIHFMAWHTRKRTRTCSTFAIGFFGLWFFDTIFFRSSS